MKDSPFRFHILPLVCQRRQMPTWREGDRRLDLTQGARWSKPCSLRSHPQHARRRCWMSPWLQRSGEAGVHPRGRRVVGPTTSGPGPRAAIRSCKRKNRQRAFPWINSGRSREPIRLPMGGPMHPGRSALLAAWWLLREIEALQARRKHTVIDFQQKKVTWRLPSSKADWKALGPERARKCCCAFSTRDLCPFHAMVEHLSNLAEDLAQTLGLGLTHPQRGKMLHQSDRSDPHGQEQHRTLENPIVRQMVKRSFLTVYPGCPCQSTRLDLAAESRAKLSIQAAQSQLQDLLRRV